jgi:hypothetical protein
MDEIAIMFTEAGLPSGFMRSAAEIFERLSGFKDDRPDLDAVLHALGVPSSAQI